MFVCVFIDWENIEKTAKQEYGSILNYEEFVNTIREVSTSNGSRLVGIQAFGDFDKGTAGLMSKLVNLGIEPKHVVTKTAQEYLKGSTDIELSLEILETMYNYPHITDFFFVSGDFDLRYVIKRLKKQGKNLRLMGFNTHTSYFLKELVNEFIPMDDYPKIMRKVTKSEKEQVSLSLLSNNFVKIIIEQLNKKESGPDSKFVGLKLFRKELTDYYQDNLTEISDALTSCLDYELLITKQEPNPINPKFPTTSCKLNRENPAVKYVLNNDKAQ